VHSCLLLVQPNERGHQPKVYADYAIVVRRSDRNFQTMAALQFHDIEPMTQKTIDNMILSLGGYRRDDHEKKREYLAWYAPNSLRPHPAHPESTQTSEEEAIEDLDFNSLEKMTRNI
jgi:hypothetical protein